MFSFPENAETYPVILLSGVARMNEGEKAAMKRYMAAGGKVIAVGPTAVDGCENSWKLPNRLDVPAEDFFTTVPDGVHIQLSEWFRNTDVERPNDPDTWQQPAEGLFYHPHRWGEINAERVLELVRTYAKPMPINVTQAKGYFSTVRQDDSGFVVQLLAEDYDADINHELDAIRTHRSRVNLLTTITPIGGYYLH